MHYFVYILRCADGRLYTGITNDVSRRLAEHQRGGSRQAKSLRGKGPFVLVFQRQMESKSAALAEERRIKRLSKAEKEALLKD